MRLRSAVPDDLLTLRRVWEAADGLPHGPERILPLHRHLLATGTVVVAEDTAEIVGFGAVIERDGVVLLSDLFVVPQGQGIGRSILTELFRRSPTGPRCTVASSHPAAVPLYRAFGMNPVCDVVHLEGVLDPMPSSEAGAEPVTIDEAVIRWLGATWGRDRSADVGYWASLGAVAVPVGGADPIGIALVCPHTPWHPAGDSVRVGPVVSANPRAAADVMTGALAVAAQIADGGRPVRVMVPELHPLAGAAGLGFREVDRDVLMASEPGVVDPVCHVGAPDLW